MKRDGLASYLSMPAAALALVAILVGCGPASTPGSAQPTTAPTLPGAPTAAPTAAATLVPTAASTAAVPTSAPTAAATQAPASQPNDALAATQIVLDYYQAIGDRAYDRAYSLWARGGAASGQTLAQFQQGFADTAGVTVQLGDASAGGGAVTVPITITSVVNLAGGEQQVRHFRGTYALRQEAGAWRLDGASIAAFAAGAQPPADVADPEALLRAYYAAIGGHGYARAYTYWGNNGANSQQTFVQFAQGFAQTAGVAIDTGTWQMNGAAGSAFADVPVVIAAAQTDGSQKTFCGTYTLRHLNVPPFDQYGWRIEQASIAPIANVQIGGDQEKRLLANGCK